MNDKPKILFIMHMPPPVHGAAIVGQNIRCSKLINEMFDCSYINLSPSATVADVGKLSLKKIISLPQLLMKILRTIKKEKPDICYYTPATTGNAIYRDALFVQCIKWSGINKIILHLHTKGVTRYSKKKTFSKNAYKILFKNNKVILLAKELMEDLDGWVKDGQVVLCHNGMPETIDESQLRQVLAKRPPLQCKARILYLSNMMSKKGIYVLLEACKLLKDQGCVFECDYVGNWGDTTYQDFSEKIHEYGLDGYVSVHGPKYGKDKIPYMENANIFVFPTFYSGETFGLVLLEAMEYALPCVSTFEGGIPSVVVDGESGLLVPQRNAKELAEKIMYLVHNPDVAVAMGMRGRERYKSSFTLSAFEYNLAGILVSYARE